jgi:hypothetical protein
MARIGGTATFYINGATQSTTGKWNVMIQNVKRDPVAAADGAIHYTEAVVPDKVSGSLLMVPGFNPDLITNATNVTIVLALLNGKTAMLDQAFFSGESNGSTESGEMEVEFSGQGQWL